MVGLIVARSKNNVIGKKGRFHGKLKVSRNSFESSQLETLS